MFFFNLQIVVQEQQKRNNFTNFQIVTTNKVQFLKIYIIIFYLFHHVANFLFCFFFFLVFVTHPSYDLKEETESKYNLVYLLFYFVFNCTLLFFYE